MSSQANCGICGTDVTSENGISVFQMLTQHSQLKRGTPHHFICDKCTVVQTRQLTSLTEFQDIKMMVKTNMLIENFLFEIIDEHMNADNVEPMISNTKYKTTTINREPSMHRWQAPSKKKVDVKKPQKEDSTNKTNILNVFLTPKEIYSKLNTSVIGQDEALKAVSVGVFRFMQSLRNPSAKKSNIMLIGPTGVGKTETVKAISEVLGLPFLSVNCSNFTPAGYKGDNVSSIAEKMYSSFGDGAQTAILYLDEVDKLVSRGDKDELKAQVQQELLKILDGDDLVASSHKGETLVLPFKRILIIASGAFPQLEESKVVRKAVGIMSKKEEEVFELKNLNNSDLFQYGLIPEFVGRFSTVSVMNALDEDAMIKILRESDKSVLHDYVSLFKEFKCEIVFYDSYLKEIVRESMSERTGTRGIKKVIDRKMEKIIFNIDAYIEGTLHLRSIENGSEEFESKVQAAAC